MLLIVDSEKLYFMGYVVMGFPPDGFEPISLFKDPSINLCRVWIEENAYKYPFYTFSIGKNYVC